MWKPICLNTLSQLSNNSGTTNTTSRGSSTNSNNDTITNIVCLNSNSDRYKLIPWEIF